MSASDYIIHENGKMELISMIECQKEELQQIINHNDAIIETKVIMADGSTKEYKNIRIGDYVMGPDSIPRQVTNTSISKKESYIIVPSKGQKFRCHAETILTLKGIIPYISFVKNKPKKYCVVQTVSGIEKCKAFLTKEEAEDFISKLGEDIFDISLEDFIKARHIKKSTYSRVFLYHTGLQFSNKELPMDPYLIGYWLGDGTCRDPVITTEDHEIVTEFQRILKRYDLNIVERKGTKYQYGIKHRDNGHVGKNIFRNTLTSCNLFDNKHIPDIYKYNSYENRMKLLAGLIDSDGYATYGSYIEINQKNIRLADDIIYLAYSLGFMVTRREEAKGCTYKGIKKFGVYQRINIFGDNIENIPTILERKRCKKRLMDKRPTCYSFKFEPNGLNTFHEIEVDGDGHYLTDDFMVASSRKLVT